MKCLRPVKRAAPNTARHGNGGYVGVMIFGRMTHDISGDAFFNVYYTDLSNEEKKELSFRDMLPVALAAMMESAASSLSSRINIFIICAAAGHSQN